MDTKIINQFGADILCYKLRTARQKKRMQYEDFDKQLIRLDKKERDLYLQKRNLGWEELKPPVQKGWVRHFVVRDDVARSKYGEFFEGILQKINTYKYSWKKDFTKKKRKLGKKIYVVRTQELLKPREYEFVKMKFTDVEKQFFTEEWELNWNKQPIKRYVFTEPWRFVLKVKPYMIDKVRINDAVLEKQLKEIDNYLERNDFKKRLCKVKHRRYRYKDWKQRVKYNEEYEYKNKTLNEIKDLIMQN
ncbi:MAG: hypothetical protein KA319_01265 [Ferruginibacter sp.]|nr:hypothetical protein [Ferruginibacter sp.]